MKKLLAILSLSLVVSCDNTDSSNNETVDATLVEEGALDSTQESNSTEDDCIFDLSTQTSDFMESIPEYANYTWDDIEKTATVVLNNSDTVTITRGGCVHYNQYIELITTANDSLSTSNIEYCLQLSQELAKKVFNEADNQLIDSLVSSNYYRVVESNHLYIEFIQDYYCQMTVYATESKSGRFTLEIGFYLC